MPTPDTGSRKEDHIRINLEEDVTFARTTSNLERYRLVHEALPEIDLNAVDPSAEFLGHHL
ncbi:MAG: type 2 isopentenyl-diphosphate Delta-isomerase, partial [Lysobacterales bacterium]